MAIFRPCRGLGASHFYPWLTPDAQKIERPAAALAFRIERLQIVDQPHAGAGAPEARMKRCLILRQGASPLRPPAPFPSDSMFRNGRNLSRVRKPRKNRAPLTDSFRSEDSPEMRERGPLKAGALSRLPLVGPEKIPGGAG
jgi:hypothetical protein